MSVRLLLDMNLPEQWVDRFAGEGIDADHWARLGDVQSPDHKIMAFARSGGWIVVTGDLDFGALLALTRSIGPSVIQIRGNGIGSERSRRAVAEGLKRWQTDLLAGALITIDRDRNRIRRLPIRREGE